MPYLCLKTELSLPPSDSFLEETLETFKGSVYRRQADELPYCLVPLLSAASIQKHLPSHYDLNDQKVAFCFYFL